MKKHALLSLVASVCFAVAILSGCTSSRLVDVWSASAGHAPVMTKMIVISVGKTPAHRRIWEDAFVFELAKHNVTATASYKLYPDAVPDTAQVLEAVQSNKVNGVIVSHWMPSETNPQVSQGYYTREPQTRYDYRRERFVTYYRGVNHPPYIDSQKVVLRSFDVWTTQNDGELIWSATSKTPDPVSMGDVRPEIVKLVTDALMENGIVGPEQK